MNHCAARGCGRWTRAGDAFCSRHQMESDGLESLALDHAEPAAFRQRLESGDYDALLGPGLRETLRAAAAGGLEEEIGALRVTLMRLLQEEGDPSRMAAGIARVAGVAVQAVRLRQGGDAPWGEILAVVEREVANLDAERARTRAMEGGEDDDAE